MRTDHIRALIVSLSTYSAPYNDGKLKYIASRVGATMVASGRVPTLWGTECKDRVGDGYEVRVLPVRFGRMNATATLIGLREVAETIRPTIIHLECEPWQSVAVQGVRLARSMAIPVGIHLAEEGRQFRGIGGVLRRTRGSWVTSRCSYAVGWSSASATIAEQLAPGIFTTTFPVSGVSTSPVVAGSADMWFGAGSDSFPRLAFVGRFAPEKGIRDFIGVCDKLASQFPLRVALAGGEGEEALVREWCAERSWVEAHGVLPRPEVSSLLSAASVLVCPSRTTRFVQEQFGKAAVEAMAVGTPVFAYACGALAETIGAGGVVVPEGAEEELVNALQGYFEGPSEAREALRLEALNQASLFTDEAIAGKLTGLWSKFARPRS